MFSEDIFLNICLWLNTKKIFLLKQLSKFHFDLIQSNPFCHKMIDLDSIPISIINRILPTHKFKNISLESTAVTNEHIPFLKNCSRLNLISTSINAQCIYSFSNCCQSLKFDYVQYVCAYVSKKSTYPIDSLNPKVSWTMRITNINLINAQNSAGETILIYLLKYCPEIRPIKIVLDAYPDINISDAEGKTALYHAVVDGTIELIKLILKHKPHIDKTSNKLMLTALHVAVQRDNIDVVKLLLQHKADPNIKNSRGHTPIVTATKKSLDQIIMLLIGAGADLNIVDTNGMSLLTTSIELNKFDLARKFITLGAKIDIDIDQDWSAFKMAVGSDDIPMVKFLLAHGANPIAGTDRKVPLISASKNKNIQMIHLLLACGTDINTQNNKGKTALSKAVAQENNFEIIKFLIETGANVNHVDTDGHSVMMTAIFNKCGLDILQLLINKGAHLNYFNPHNQNVLITAIITKSIDIAEYLLDLGIKYEYFDHLGQTPIGLCWKYNLYSVAEKIITMGLRNINTNAIVSIENTESNNTLVQLAIDSNRPDLLRLLEKYGADMNLILNNYTPLIYAIQKKSHQMLDVLISLGADVFIGPDDTVPISIAIKTMNEYAVRKLLFHRTLINTIVRVDGHSYSLLMYAIFLNTSKTIIELLVDAHIDINFKSDTGETALSLALKYIDNIPIVMYLLQAGADHTPIDLEIWNIYINVAQIEKISDSVINKIHSIIFAEDQMIK